MIAVCMGLLVSVYLLTMVFFVQPVARLLAAEPESKSFGVARISVRESGGRYVIEGNLPESRQKESIDQRAKSLYGASGFDDRIQVNPSLGHEEWMDRVADFLPPTGSHFGEGSVSIESGRAMLVGTTKNEDEHQVYVDHVRKMTASLEVTDQMLVERHLAPAPQALQDELNRAVLNRTIEFEVNSDVLSTNGKELLDKVAVLMVDAGTLDVEVDGHTDDSGTPEANLDLSQRRAESVCNYLSEHGVPRSRLKAKGFGQTKPIADNSSEEGRYKNRRISFIVL